MDGVIHELKILLAVFKNCIANLHLDLEKFLCNQSDAVTEQLMSNLKQLINYITSMKKLGKFLKRESDSIPCLSCVLKSSQS